MKRDLMQAGLSSYSQRETKRSDNVTVTESIHYVRGMSN